jgi:hypothetical protein
MSTDRWRITDWASGALPADFAGLFVKGRFLTRNDGESLTLEWEDSEGHRCSITLPDNRKEEGAFGAPVPVKREGCPDLSVSASVKVNWDESPAALVGRLQLVKKSGTPPGTFAATLDPGVGSGKAEP